MSNQRISPLGWLAMALVIAIGLMAVFGALSASTNGGYYGMMGSGAWGWGILMMAVPGIILILILVAVIGGLGERGPYAPYPVAATPYWTPIDLLAERYVRGEISREEYLRMREDLARGTAPA